MPAKRPSKVELKTLGTSILKRYSPHPKWWKNGDSTGKPHLRNAMVLKVEEIRLGSGALVTVEEAQMNASAIRAWATWMGLNTVQLQVDQRANKAPYVFVPMQYWDHVLKFLQGI